LVTLPADIKKRMVLVHYQDNVLEEDGTIKDSWTIQEEEAGFNYGFAIKGQELDIDEIFSIDAKV